MRIALAAGIALLIASAPIASAGEGNVQTEVLKVDTAKVIQPDFLGVNAVYHGFAFMPEQTAKGMNDVDRAREFDRVSAIGLRIARTWYTPHLATGAGLDKPFDWESRYMKAFYAWLAAMKERNVDVALQLGWWFPKHARPLDRYTEWVSESLHQIVQKRGFTNVRYAILFTEPKYTDEYKVMARALHARLVKDGRRKLIRIVGPNQTGNGPDLAAVVRDLDDVIDIYSSHNYNFGGYDGWKKSADDMMKQIAATGKPFWYDEYGRQDYRKRHGGEYGNYIAQAVAAFMNAGAQTSLVWLLFDQQYVWPHHDTTNGDSFFDGVHRWGFCKWPHDKVSEPTCPYPSWYAFSLMSRYLGGGKDTRVYRTIGTKKAAITAVRQPNGDWSFLIVNLTGGDFPIRTELGSPLKKTLYRYLYVPTRVIPDEAAKLIGYSRVFKDVGAVFEDTLPRNAVAVYSTIAGQKAEE
ncbi:hypothetical protein ACFL01_02325, partial [Planctomycetota bacterium]